jgi:hypothetical protein
MPPHFWQPCGLPTTTEFTPVTDLDFFSSPLPDRPTLDAAAFKRAFEELQRREQKAGRTITLEAFNEKAGINDRVFRKARTKHTTLPRHQVLKIAELLGCQPESIVEPFRKHPSPSVWDERDCKDRAAWPVPLREVASWVEFVEHLVRANSVRPSWRDDVLSLAAAPAIDAFNTALRHSSLVAKEDNPAIAAAMLKDAADDLLALDLHVLAGRYLARTETGNSYGSVELVYVLEVWIRRETEDLAHVVDRSHEPMCTSDGEDSHQDDEGEEWLAWQGKQRLFLWRGPPD